jgi:hypothetical protein
MKAVADNTPAMTSIRDFLIKTIPLPERSIIEAEKRFYRLPNHNRSFCYALSDTENIFSSPAIVFKGVEPLLPEFARTIDWMLLAPVRRSPRVMADHFPLSEGKIPGALSLNEAMREAAIASELQSKHLQYYGELARLPVPLLVHRFSKEHKESCAALLKRKLSDVAFERIEPLLSAGLGVYIYYYPAAPARADIYGSGGSPKLMDYAAKRCSPEAMVARWVQLLARLLYLGYLPYTPRNDGLGACMDFGNASLDGGFCDLDSVQPIASAGTDEFVYESLISSLRVLQTTVARVVSPACGLEQDHLYPSIETFVLSRYLGAAFQEALETEARPGLSLDGRIRDVLSPKHFGELKKLLARKTRPHNLSLYLRTCAR